MAKPGEDKPKEVPGATAASGTGAMEKKPDAPLSKDTVRPELEGLENLEATDIKVPQLRLLQGQAPDILDGYGAVGDFIDSVTKKNFGKSVLFIPLTFGGRMRFKWNTRDEGGWDCMSRDGKQGSKPRTINQAGEKEYGGCLTCRFTKFNTCTHKDKEHLPACTEVPSYFVHVPGEPFFKGLGFPRTKMKVFTDFSTMLRLQAEQEGAVPIRHKRFRLETVQQSAHGNTWLNYKITADGILTPEEKGDMDAKYAMIMENFARFAIDMEEEAPATPGGGADPGSPKY